MIKNNFTKIIDSPIKLLDKLNSILQKKYFNYKYKNFSLDIEYEPKKQLTEQEMADILNKRKKEKLPSEKEQISNFVEETASYIKDKSTIEFNKKSFGLNN